MVLGDTPVLAGTLFTRTPGLPLAFTTQTSFTHTATAQPGGAAPGFKPNDNAAVDAYLVSIAEHLPAKEEATALRALTLWGRAMTASRQGPDGSSVGGDR